MVGMRISHGAPELTRAVLEGVAFALAEGLDLMRGVGVAPTSGVVAGGGVNRLWQQIIADVLNLPVALGATEHGSARGAAFARRRCRRRHPFDSERSPAAACRHPPDGARPGQRQALRRHFRHLPRALRAPAEGIAGRGGPPTSAGGRVLDALLVHDPDPLERRRRDSAQVGCRRVGPRCSADLRPGSPPSRRRT